MQPKQAGTFLSTVDNLYLNPNFTHSIVSTGTQISASTISQLKQLYFQFYIKPLESIRLLSQNNKSVIKLTLGTLTIKINLVKNSDQFIFQQGIYRNYLSTQLVLNADQKVQVGKKEVKIGEWTRMLLIIQKAISVGKGKWVLEECNPVIQIGDFKKQKCFQCRIKQVKLVSSKQLLYKQHGSTKNQIKSEAVLYDGPLDTIPKTPIPDIKTLQQYKSPPEKADKLYFCHDMAGGYNQDINKHHPFPKQQNKYDLDQNYQHTYRSLHLVQTSIFNYFSHHLITIPPKHWRRLCKKAGTLCLGTFIVQKQHPTQQQYLTDYTINLLIYLCKKYKFDGYLLNLQYQIKNVNKLLTPWLKKFVHEMHEAIPGSKIIWYDSVIRNGKVSYQNQINQHNAIFYKSCDGMFLNYWWNQQKLVKTLSHQVEDKMIYVGSDCFGRGTYEGGGLNTFKAIHTIKKVDKGMGVLAPALFAIGYTYETDKQNIQGWKLQQKCMYRGMSFLKQTIPHKIWQYVNNYTNGFNWKIQNQWAITSFQNCRRMVGIDIKNLLKSENKANIIVSFFTTVQGTGPKFEDVYRISLSFLIGDTVIDTVQTGTKYASQHQQIIQLKISIDSELITQDSKLLIVQQGHDVQKWGGHFGTRFKNDSLYVIKYTKEDDWIAKYRTNFINGVQLPYRTNYNLGHGNYFHLQGRKVKKAYDFMSDYEANFTYIMNPPLSVHICYTDAYTGGTSLMVQKTKKVKLVQLNIPNKSNKSLQKQQQSTNSDKKLKGRIVVKNLQGETKYKISYRWKQELKQAKIEEDGQQKHGWKLYTFQILLQDQDDQQELNNKLTLFLQSSNQNKYLIGQTALYYAKTTNKQSQTKIEQLWLKSSQNNPPISPFLFDAQIKLNRPQKILIQYGQNFGCFGYADQYNNNIIRIKNIYCKSNLVNKSIILKLSKLNQQMQYKELAKVQVDGKKLAYENSIKYI